MNFLHPFGRRRSDRSHLKSLKQCVQQRKHNQARSNPCSRIFRSNSVMKSCYFLVSSGSLHFDRFRGKKELSARWLSLFFCLLSSSCSLLRPKHKILSGIHFSFQNCSIKGPGGYKYRFQAFLEKCHASHRIIASNSWKFGLCGFVWGDCTLFEHSCLLFIIHHGSRTERPYRSKQQKEPKARFLQRPESLYYSTVQK